MRIKLSTDLYVITRGGKPRGHGTWVFQNRDGKRIERRGVFAQVRNSLPRGQWRVLPA